MSLGFQVVELNMPKIVNSLPSYILDLPVKIRCNILRANGTASS
jgi:hypothetical protein